MTSIFWFRRDARLDDNPALVAALEEGPVIPVFVIDPRLMAAAHERRRNLLVAGLIDLDTRLREHGGRLHVITGDPRRVIPRLVDEVGPVKVHVSREVTPYGLARDRAVANEVELRETDGVYAHPPGSVLTNEDRPYRVFTPFYRAWSHLLVSPVELPENPEFSDSGGDGLPQSPDPVVPAGPSAAENRLREFQERVGGYDRERDRIDLDTTSHASVDLKFGWIGPRRLISEIGEARDAGRSAFVRQVAWRDFYGHLLAEYPDIVNAAFDERYEGLSWRNDPDEIEAWKQGRTGYPLVDAAMRRLVQEGQMHNRARLIVASFLVKDLLVDWRIGERFFRHHLVDGDVSQNSWNWQWVAGVGTDAAPYFRVFNPISQSRRFDPDGVFIRRWLPELTSIPDQWVHAPWEAGPLELISHGVELGRDYPYPIVEHAMARRRALAAYEEARGSR